MEVEIHIGFRTIRNFTVLQISNIKFWVEFLDDCGLVCTYVYVFVYFHWKVWVLILLYNLFIYFRDILTFEFHKKCLLASRPAIHICLVGNIEFFSQTTIPEEYFIKQEAFRINFTIGIIK